LIFDRDKCVATKNHKGIPSYDDLKNDSLNYYKTTKIKINLAMSSPKFELYLINHFESYNITDPNDIDRKINELSIKRTNKRYNKSDID
jgi:hypothetical protein